MEMYSNRSTITESEKGAMCAMVHVIGDTSCRTPLVTRIKALHIQIEERYSDVDTALRKAWMFCHQLKTTPLVLSLIHRTQKLWAEYHGSLDNLPSHAVAPPEGGYKVRDPAKCS
jgi:hypothetical protein